MQLLVSSMYTTLAHPTPTTFPHHVQRSSAETDRDGRREESERVPRERLAIVLSWSDKADTMMTA